MGQILGDNENHQQNSQSCYKSISSKMTCNSVSVLKAWICWSSLGPSVQAEKTQHTHKSSIPQNQKKLREVYGCEL